LLAANSSKSRCMLKVSSSTRGGSYDHVEVLTIFPRTHPGFNRYRLNINTLIPKLRDLNKDFKWADGAAVRAELTSQVGSWGQNAAQPSNSCIFAVSICTAYVSWYHQHIRQQLGDTLTGLGSTWRLH
jgi:hypothetical protein